MQYISTLFVVAASALAYDPAHAQTLYRLGTGPGGAETQVSLMSRDATGVLVRTMSGVGAGFDWFSLQNLALGQPGIRAQWTNFGAAIAPGVSGGTQFYGTLTASPTSFVAAYSGLSGAATPFTLQGGSVQLGRSGFQDGNARPVNEFVGIGNSRATGFDRPWVYRPGGPGGPFNYLAMPAGFENALAQRVSDDGRYTFGVATTTGAARMIVWDGTSIHTSIAYPAGLSISDVNSDGSFAVGRLNNEAVFISRAGAITGMGSFPGGGTILPTAVSGDGSIVVGLATLSTNGAWIWTSSGGYAPATSYFASVLPAGAFVTRMDSVSEDGRTFAGQMSTTAGLEAFVITNWVPAPSGGVALAFAGILAGSRRRR